MIGPEGSPPVRGRFVSGVVAVVVGVVVVVVVVP